MKTLRSSPLSRLGWKLSCGLAFAPREVPGSVALGGTVCALYTQHRLSVDIDFVVDDLRERFDEVREHLQDVTGWRESRVKAPVLILGSLDGVEIGYRQQRRRAPIETTQLQTADGSLSIPTAAELIRIKAVLAYERNVARDFVDLAELVALLGQDSAAAILRELDERLGTDARPELLGEVVKNLLLCEPRDLEENGYETFRWLHPRNKSWAEVATVIRSLGRALAIRNIVPEQGT